MAQKYTLFSICFLLAAGLCACTAHPYPGQAAAPVTKTISQVNLTRTQTLPPPPTQTPPPPNPLPTPSRLPFSTGTPLSAATLTPEVSCNLAAPGTPLDVTIPDDTLLAPNQHFVKTWRLRNEGSCIWTQDYNLVFFSGSRMSAEPTYRLLRTVMPGQSIDLTVEMTAPLQHGLYQGNWKLRSASGDFFGIGPNGQAPFWVRIQVDNPSPEEDNSTPTPAAVTKALTGLVILMPSDGLKLDTQSISSDPASVDLLYDSMDGLDPQNDAEWAFFGNRPPEPGECDTLNFSSTPLDVQNLTSSDYICFHTGLGLTGWLRLSSFDMDSGTLLLDITSWR
ncbi:MAG TPA: NBR1-Ig-like domain-containing protein [Anaerolineaceae bacterium]|nr:NBR1-Ig-like domain-containing protein [Anaerolineaceae bacterium]HPN51603.1 NBR1-Ig-like domain-containing protein [Anaerolineaceae bacterium]